MLLTNFAAGELSVDLYGRTDLGQYFQGAARVENFDIIPTGGINKRNGSKLLRDLDENPAGCRLIPFIIDRKNSFLIGLFPERSKEEPALVKMLGLLKTERGEQAMEMPLYIHGKDVKENARAGTGNNTVDPNIFHFAKTMKEINEVQYAQRNNVMILVHPGYPPIQVLYGDGKFNIKKAVFTSLVSYEGDDTLKLDLPEVSDETYLSGRLTMTHEYPSTVCFFQNRLIFAGTNRERQRVFVSNVEDIYSFSTYKIFLTQERNYIAVTGKIENPQKPEEPCRITLEMGEQTKFIKPLRDYHVDSYLFEDKTYITVLDGNKLELSANIKNFMVSADEITAARNVANNFQDYNAKPEEIKIEIKEFDIDHQVLWMNFELYHHSEFYIRIGANFIAFYLYLRTWEQDILKNKYPKSEQTHSKRYTFPIRIAEEITLNSGYFDNFYRQCLDNFKSLNKDLFERSRLYDVYASDKWKNINDTVNARVKASMEYYLESSNKWFYKPGPDIRQELENFVEGLKTVVIPFYTEKIIQTKTPTPDCGFTFEIASEMSDAIKWMVFNKHLIIGTETAEWIIPAGVTAFTIEAVLNSRYGSDKIPGVTIGDAVVFMQSGKKAMVEYYLPQQDNNFRANNMTLFSKEMLHESPARGFDFCSTPYTRIFICREDGALVSLLYERSTGTYAWSRITMPGAEILSVAVLPGSDGFDNVYLSVKRGDKAYLEVVKTGENVYGENVYLDSFKQTWKAVWAGDITGYDAKTARVVRIDGDEYETLAADKEPDWKRGGDFYIGYPYKSVLRTMPLLTNNEMKKQRITGLSFRFLKSFLPKVSSIAGGRLIKTDTITNVKTPYSGVHKIPFPGTWDEDVQVELVHEEAEPVKILAINAEVQ